MLAVPCVLIGKFRVIEEVSKDTPGFLSSFIKFEDKTVKIAETSPECYH